MTDYGFDIQPETYYNHRRLYINETSGTDRYFIPLKLELNSSNFNFDTVRQDGFDFRITETQNGTNVLQMWTAYWDYTSRTAIVWFKLPFLAANETKTLYVFWGSDDDLGVSDLKYMLGESVDGGPVSTPVFLFGDGFDDDLSKIESLCIGGTAFADSYHGSSYSPDKAFDGGNTTAWLNIVDGTSYVGYEFSSPVVVDRIIFILNSSQWTDVVFEASDNQSGPYTVLKSIPDVFVASTPYEYFFSNSTAYKYYRYRGIAGVSHIGLYELRMYNAESVGNWIVYGDYTISDSKIELDVNAFIQSKEVLPEVANSGWIIEEGILLEDCYTAGTPSFYSHRYTILGGENELTAEYHWGNERSNNFEYGGDTVNCNETERGFEEYSYSHNYIAYRESTDKVYQGMHHRDTYIDYDDEWERKVHRNTEVSYFRIYGRELGTYTSIVKIDWIVVREYNPSSDPVIDYSELYIPYEEIPHQPLDFTEYTSDITDIDYYHSSDMGGNPYKLSDNSSGDLTDIFSSDVTTSGSVLIDFGRKSTNLVDVTYSHYDNNRITYYNASKLSDSDTDRLDRNYWQCTTSSGVWAAIKFPSSEMIGCLVVNAVDGKLDGMIKDFNFYGSNKDPRLASIEDKYLLYNGTFRRVLTKQSIHFTTNGRLFKYYILEALNSYGSDIALQEWEMYELADGVGKRVVSQIRLYPAAFESNEYYFPKSIEFYAGNNLSDWVKLLDTTRTYTPFQDATYGRWQRYSVENDTAYYCYKLVCKDNWYAQSDIIKIAEWEMVTKTVEETTFRILDGGLENINNIWADPTATFEDGNVYITNDKLNVVMDDTLIESTTVSGLVSDMNIRV